jgi:hypothetical protein
MKIKGLNVPRGTIWADKSLNRNPVARPRTNKGRKLAIASHLADVPRSQSGQNGSES